MLPHNPPDPGEIAPDFDLTGMSPAWRKVLGRELARDRLKREADEARIMSLTQENKRLRSILAHLCADPDLVGRSCGECLPCQLVVAAKRDAAASTTGEENER